MDNTQRLLFIRNRINEELKRYYENLDCDDFGLTSKELKDHTREWKTIHKDIEDMKKGTQED